MNNNFDGTHNKYISNTKVMNRIYFTVDNTEQYYLVSYFNVIFASLYDEVCKALYY